MTILGGALCHYSVLTRRFVYAFPVYLEKNICHNREQFCFSSVRIIATAGN